MLNETEAYEWWNSHIRKKSKEFDLISDDTPPECIIPQKAYIAWSNICPFFQYVNIYHTDIQSYWEFIQKIVSYFFPKEQVPNPISHFPEFIVKLYSIRDFLLPKTISACIKFIDAFSSGNYISSELNSQNSNRNSFKNKNKSTTKSHQTVNPKNEQNENNLFHQNAGTFCIYNLPMCFIDPVLYFQTLNALNSMNYPLWKNVISNSKVVDAFFEMHTNFIIPLPSHSSSEFWEHRLNLSDILFHLIEYIFVGNSSSSILKTHPKSYQFTIKFLEFSIKLAKTAAYSISIIFFRYVIRIFKITQNKIPSDQIKSLCLHFLLSLDKSNSPLTALALKFVFSMKPLLVPQSRVLRIISKRSVKSLTDIETVSALCEGTNILPSLILLSRTMITSKLWHRACAHEIAGIILRYNERNDVKDWFALFVRRLFIFIGIAAGRAKYRTRTLLIAESLSSMVSLKVIWLQQAVLTGAASIWVTKSVPPYFKNFFPLSAPVDEVVIHEFENFANSKIDLKEFPFDPIKGTLALPPFVDIHKNRKSSLSHRADKSASKINNTNFAASKSSVSALGPVRTTSRSETFSGRNEPKIIKQKKRPEPLIKKPSGTKQTRPLASAICVSPIHRL